jgi:UDPglucose 6-dehydrogenase
VDENYEIIHNLNSGKAPLFEPGLDDLILKGISAGRLTFQNDIKACTKDTQFIVIAYDTPVDEHDNLDLSIVMRTVDRLKNTEFHATLIISSQVPVGTCQQIEKALSRSGLVGVAYVPENLRLGQAIECFIRPDMIVIGAENKTVIAKVKELYSLIHTKIIEMNLRSAEMTKHALNSYLATSISFANEIGNICDLVKADGLKVAMALKADSRIGQKALVRPGLGFAGGTLARDLRVLQNVGKKNGYQTSLINSVLIVNERQNNSVVDKLKRLMGRLDGKTVSVFGLTYKAGTSTLRRSAALEIIKRLNDEGAVVKAYDPRVSVSEANALGVDVFPDPYSACEMSEAMVIVNDLFQFTGLDFTKIKSVMKTPLVLDAQNILEPSKVTRSGMKYIGVGRGMVQ